jgi:hypothetical protein
MRNCHPDDSVARAVLFGRLAGTGRATVPATGAAGHEYVT